MVDWLSPAEIARDAGPHHTTAYIHRVASDSFSQRRSTSSCTSSLGCTCTYHGTRSTSIKTDIALSVSWEWFTSIEFDWDFIRGRRKFRWPMVSSHGECSPLLAVDILFLESLLSPLRAHRNVSVHHTIPTSISNQRIFRQRNCIEYHQVISCFSCVSPQPS
jgi:hypothetical protein